LEGSKKIILYRDPDGTLYQLDKLPSCLVDVTTVAKELGLPDYVDLAVPAIERACVSIWASFNASRILGSVMGGTGISTPVTPLLLGGAAVKMLCPVANKPFGPMERKVNDLDFVVPKSEGSKFTKLLSLLSYVAGTRYHHFLTQGDRRFNAIRAGDRFRIHCVDWTLYCDPIVGWLDIFVGRIDMRHRIEIMEEFTEARRNIYTIGLEKMLMSKCQSINDIQAKDLGLVKESAQEFRILGYRYYDPRRIILGLEEKDFLDVCALLHDHPPQEDGVNPTKLASLLKRDEKFLLTFRLNLENIVVRAEWLHDKRLTESQISRVSDAAGAILKALPSVDKKWTKPWWNTSVDTPLVS
jgi:hypothetical protein